MAKLGNSQETLTNVAMSQFGHKNDTLPKTKCLNWKILIKLLPRNLFFFFCFFFKFPL